METIFVGESSINFNQWTSEFHQKLKIGEIFQLSDNSLSMCCVHCLQEFQYFTEFTLHIQEHLAQFNLEIKEEISTEIHNEPEHDEEIIAAEEKCEVIQNDVSDFSNDDTYMGWSDVDENTVLDQQERSPENSSIVEGTDYEKLKDKFKCLTCDHVMPNFFQLKEHLLIHLNPKDVVCPICSKLFATIAYVQKHCNRTHNQKIPLDKIKKSQPLKYNNKAVAPSPPLPSPPPPLPKKSKTERKAYTDGTDYRKVGDKFQCLTCNRQMTKLDHLREHLLTHTSEKNVLCPFCARAFITESYVRKHGIGFLNIYFMRFILYSVYL